MKWWFSWDHQWKWMGFLGVSREYVDSSRFCGIWWGFNGNDRRYHWGVVENLGFSGIDRWFSSETRKSIVKTFFDWWEHNVDWRDSWTEQNCGKIMVHFIRRGLHWYIVNSYIERIWDLQVYPEIGILWRKPWNVHWVYHPHVVSPFCHLFQTYGYSWVFGTAHGSCHPSIKPRNDEKFQ